MSNDTYTGFQELELPDEELAKFYETNIIDNYDFITNQYLLLKKDDKIVDKYRFDGNKFVKLRNFKFKHLSILKPLDTVQYCAYDALFNEDIKVICLTGKSGTGKTKTALSVGLELMKLGLYEKVILVRQAEESGKSIGFLKGDKNGKMVDGWAGCFYDNLEGEKYEFEDLLNRGKIEIESLSLLKGRNFKDSFVIFDEAEDAYPSHVELVGTRINDSSKLIYVGDYDQVSNRKYKDNSGLLKLIDKAKGEDWFACIELQSNGRGVVADWFATVYRD